MLLYPLFFTNLNYDVIFLKSGHYKIVGREDVTDSIVIYLALLLNLQTKSKRKCMSWGISLSVIAHHLHCN